MATIGKGQLHVDSTTPADGDTLAAYLYASAKLTSTNNGGKESLDVNVTGLTATDVDIRDLDAAQDNVAISDGTDTLGINADGSINAVVTATNLDIRDLTHVSDSIQIGDGTDLMLVNADGSINAVVTATNLDIRDLTSASDSVAALGNVADDAADSGNPVKVGMRAVQTLSAVSAANDRADMISDLYRQLLVKDTHNIAVIPKGVIISNVAVQLDSGVGAYPAALAGRKEITLQNFDNKSVHLGFDNTVTATGATRGFKVPSFATFSMKWGDNVQVWAIGEQVNAVVAAVFGQAA